MGKNQIFNQIIACVCEVMEVDVELVLSNIRTTDIVDARCITIHLLEEYGVYRSYISQKMDRTESGIRYLLSIYDNRYNTNMWFRSNCEVIRQKIKSIY